MEAVKMILELPDGRLFQWKRGVGGQSRTAVWPRELWKWPGMEAEELDRSALGMGGM